MKRFLLAIALLFAFTLSACNTDDGVAMRQFYDGETILPFGDDGFMLGQTYFDEWRDVFFRFSEGRVDFDDYNGKFYEADNFLSHTNRFVNMMNGLTPTLIEAFTLPRFEPHGFDEVTGNNYLYRLQINDVFMRMDVIEAADRTLLYFYIFEREVIEHEDHTQILTADISHHSLYEISAADLRNINRFVNRLNRVERLWTATPWSD